MEVRGVVEGHDESATCRRDRTERVGLPSRELKRILEKHRCWIANQRGEKILEADRYLEEVKLPCPQWRHEPLSSPGQAIWHNADLTEANLRLANLSRADLSGAILNGDPGRRT